MEKFKKWSVLIDLDKNNEPFVQQLSQLADQFVPQSISFICTENKDELPKELLADLPDLVETESREKLKTFKSMVKSRIHQDHHLGFTQLVNSRIGQVLKKISLENTELLIIEKLANDGLSNLQQRITRKTGASVLLLSEQGTTDWKDILVPIDLSIYSDMSLEIANALVKGNPSIQMNFLHIYQDASRYLNQVFETADEVQSVISRTNMVNKKLEKYAKTRVQEYLDVQLSGLYNAEVIDHGRDKSVSDVLKSRMVNNPNQLVIMGSKGTSKSIASLMGNTADEMVKDRGIYSVLIIKQKGENKGFLSSFLP